MVLRIFVSLVVGAGALALHAAGNRGAVPTTAGDSSRCSAKETFVSAPAPLAPDQRLPFAIGEHLTYSVSFGVFHVGSGEMRLEARDTTRGIGTWRATYAVSGGFKKLSVHDTNTSWFDSVSFNSLRFVQHINDPSYHSYRDTKIFPDRRIYQKNAEPELASVADPMDDVSLVYFVRTLPLATGDCYVLQRYFNPDGNPVVIHVLRREKGVRVPFGKYDAIVVRPEITTSGMFSKGGRAELWLSDDSARVVLQLKSRVPALPFGSLNLYLTRIDSAPPG